MNTLQTQFKQFLGNYKGNFQGTFSEEFSGEIVDEFLRDFYGIFRIFFATFLGDFLLTPFAINNDLYDKGFIIKLIYFSNSESAE